MSQLQTTQEFSALFNNVAIGIITANSLGEIVLTNQFALNQFGYSDGELTGKKIETLIPSRFNPHHVQHRDKYFHHPYSRSMGIGMDLFGLKKNGEEFPVEVSLSPFTTSEGAFVMAFISDITIRKNAEFALVKLNQELEQKVKDRTESLILALEKEKDLNELKSRFVSMASHEFRTPLSTILSSAYLALKYEATTEQPKREKHMNRIVSSVELLTDILNDFLSLGKIEEGKIQVRLTDVDIVDCINTVISEMSANLKMGQAFVYQHSGKKTLCSDTSLIRHIIMNLFSNAVKFSPENAPIEVASGWEGDLLFISVKDSGLGISNEDQQHLFERFFRGNNVSNIQGTGLGLHIIKKYAELIEGTIICRSEIGTGSEFIVSLKSIL